MTIEELTEVEKLELEAFKKVLSKIGWTLTVDESLADNEQIFRSREIAVSKNWQYSSDWAEETLIEIDEWRKTVVDIFAGEMKIPTYREVDNMTLPELYEALEAITIAEWTMHRELLAEYVRDTIQILESI